MKKTDCQSWPQPTHGSEKYPFAFSHQPLHIIFHIVVFWTFFLFHISCCMCLFGSQVDVGPCILELFFSHVLRRKTLAVKLMPIFSQSGKKWAYHWRDLLRPIWLFLLLSWIPCNALWAEPTPIELFNKNHYWSKAICEACLFCMDTQSPLMCV